MIFKCPYCGEVIGKPGTIGGDFAPPDPGDCYVCILCSGVSIWDEGQLREPTEKELIEISENRETMFILMLSKAYQLFKRPNDKN